MTTVENEVGEEVNNGFGYGQLEHDQFETGAQKRRCNVNCFCLYTSFLSMCKHIWLKMKGAFRRYGNEYRVSILVLAILIFMCFCILIRLSINAGEGPRTDVQKNKGRIAILVIKNCTISQPCDIGEGICKSDRECRNALKCGDKNCSIKKKLTHLLPVKEEDNAGNCCFRPKDSRNITSSSIHNNDNKNWGPEFITDGIFAKYGRNFFQSKKEDFPWIQWKLPMQFIIRGVNITLPNAWSSHRLRNIEVRAGLFTTEAEFAGKIEVNKKCGEYKGPSEAGGEYSIMCAEPILADFITVQLLDDNSVLRIDELRILKDVNSLQCVGNTSCCIPGIPCGAGEGDCDSDSDCEEGLTCGHNNCPIKSGGAWDMADDCCVKPSKVKGSAIASSINRDQNRKYGPGFAIDGLWATKGYNIFTSKVEKLPWLQWKLPNRTHIIGLAISDRYAIAPFKNHTTHSTNDLLNIEVRAGALPIYGGYKGIIRSNQLCGRIEVRGGEDRVYTIMCGKSIYTNYITVQLIDDGVALHINELEVIDHLEGSKVGCTCHDFINPNGYGMCNKTSSYEHIKNKAVCYVNQPSNCSDLAFSSTNPGKKFSAEACILDGSQFLTTTAASTTTATHQNTGTTPKTSATSGSLVLIQAHGPNGNSNSFFKKPWREYKSGFRGNNNGDIWIGLEKQHELTFKGEWQLLVKLTDWDGVVYNASYGSYKIGNEQSGYKLSISGYDPSSSTLGDGFAVTHDKLGRGKHHGQRFSTYDKDQDGSGGTDCSNYWGGGGWWMNRCFYANLNGGLYGRSSNEKGIYWYHGGKRGESKSSWKASKMILIKKH